MSGVVDLIPSNGPEIMIEWNSQPAIWHSCTSRPVEKTLTMHLLNWNYPRRRSSVIWIDTANLLPAVFPRLKPAICYFWKAVLSEVQCLISVRCWPEQSFPNVPRQRERSDNGHGTELCNRSVLRFWPGSCDVANRQNVSLKVTSQIPCQRSDVG